MPKNFTDENMVDVNKRHSLEKSAQWLDNDDRTILVLASGKGSTTKIFPFLPGAMTSFNMHSLGQRALIGAQHSNLYTATILVLFLELMWLTIGAFTIKL